MSLHDLQARVASGASFAGTAVALTFDDGYRDNLTIALPILRKHKAPATIFVPSGAPDRDMDVWFLRLENAVMESEVLKLDLPGLPSSVSVRTPEQKYRAYRALSNHIHRDLQRKRHLASVIWPSRKISDEALIANLMVDWAELRAAAGDPMLAIGGHTVSHPVLERLDPFEAYREIAVGRQRLEAEIHHPVTQFSFPYGGRGECGPREFDMVARAGFDLAVTTRYGTIRPHQFRKPFALPRITLGGLREDLRELALDVFGASTRPQQPSRNAPSVVFGS